MNPIVSDRMEDLARLCEERRVARLDVFGSAVTGEFDPETSDLDFLVTFRDPADEGELHKRFDLAHALEDLFGRKVDVVPERSITNPYFRANVEDTREPVYPQSAAATQPRKNGRGDKAVIMRRVQCSLLRDIVEGAETIQSMASEKTLADYLRDRWLRAAVERCYITVGGAMGQLVKRLPDIANRFTDHQTVVEFRNIMVHYSRATDHEKVWNHAVKDLPPLLREARALLAECEDDYRARSD